MWFKMENEVAESSSLEYSSLFSV